MNIYVGNLAYSTSEDELRQLFAEHGEVSRVNVITDRYTGQSKGFGFVEMSSDSEAEAAIAALNETDLGGRNIRVNQAKPREPRPPRGGGGGGGGW
jgi:RNA recognition motif-containing protein